MKDLKINQTVMAKHCLASDTLNLVNDSLASLSELYLNWLKWHDCSCYKISENSRPKIYLLILHSLDLVNGASRYLWLLPRRILFLLLYHHLLRDLITFALHAIQLVRLVELLVLSGQLIQLLLATLSHSLFFKLMMIDAFFAKRLRRDHCRQARPMTVKIKFS